MYFNANDYTHRDRLGSYRYCNAHSHQYSDDTYRNAYRNAYFNSYAWHANTDGNTHDARSEYVEPSITFLMKGLVLVGQALFSPAHLQCPPTDPHSCLLMMIPPLRTAWRRSWSAQDSMCWLSRMA